MCSLAFGMYSSAKEQDATGNETKVLGALENSDNWMPDALHVIRLRL